VAVLRQGVKDKRIITVALYELESFGVPRSKLRDKEAAYMYKKDRCMRCDTENRSLGYRSVDGTSANAMMWR
jgi:hypothetical protein